ncbi:DUF4102 domain-containing protein [Hassallia byssoidea VB512170]|uniref:DUF4102 domain-containing protein n=1 Tax=Hassallia byssoidea VB512170 TaxID=1304833 RepID=A0A846HQE0_9CYAN|nr:hypothetical protein [Hassalia byssoidea]NEU77451.1 DUF4102 domain-containing protein [Hassalia byssoidea VB512170]
MKYKQLELFFIPPATRTAVIDPFWDEIEKGTEKTNTVREQVNSTTAPEHNCAESLVASDTNQPHTHWVEKYWVKRRGEKHEYYRYCWMEGRKIYRCHISGRAGSVGANQRKQVVCEAILDGQSPQEIVALVRQYIRGH